MLSALNFASGFRAFARSCLLALLLALMSANSVQAGLLGALLRSADNVTPSGSRHLDRLVPSASEGMSLARTLPELPDSARLSLLPDKGNGWRIVTEDGSEISISSLNELPTSLKEVQSLSRKGLAGSIAKDVPIARHQIAVRQEDYFALKDRLASMPGLLDLHMVRKTGKALALRRVVLPGGRYLVVDLGDGILLNPATAAALDANLGYLARGFNKANLRVARFDSKQTSSTSSGLSGEIVALNPDYLTASFARFKLLTVMVTGKIAPVGPGGKRMLEIQDGKSTRSMDLAELEKAAQEQRVNLMVVESNSALQPGMGWFSKTGLEKNIDKAKASITQKALLQSLAPKGAPVLINAAEDGNTRLMISASYLQERPSSAAKRGAESGSQERSLSDIVISSVAQTGTRHVYINAEDPEHTEEVESRWLPWFSNIDLVMSLVGLLIFGLISRISLRWWRWCGDWLCKKTVGHQGAFSKPVRIVGMVLFLPFAVLAFPCALIWLVIRDWVALALWPCRKLFGLFRKS